MKKLLLSISLLASPMILAMHTPEASDDELPAEDRTALGRNREWESSDSSEDEGFSAQRDAAREVGRAVSTYKSKLRDNDFENDFEKLESLESLFRSYDFAKSAMPEFKTGPGITPSATPLRNISKSLHQIQGLSDSYLQQFMRNLKKLHLEFRTNFQTMTAEQQQEIIRRAAHYNQLYNEILRVFGQKRFDDVLRQGQQMLNEINLIIMGRN